MNINSNLINLLRSLAEAAENGGINVDININVSMDSSSSQSTAPEQSSSEKVVPDGDEEQVQILKDIDELDEFLHGKSPEAEKTETSSEEAVEETEAVPSSSETKSEEPSVAVSQKKEGRPSPRPNKVVTPAAGSNGRCIKMVLQRQKQLIGLGREVPDDLLQAPSDEAHAQQMLSQLRPYLVN